MKTIKLDRERPNANTMWSCNKCYTPIYQHYSFCWHCGVKIEWIEKEDTEDTEDTEDK